MRNWTSGWDWLSMGFLIVVVWAVIGAVIVAGSAQHSGCEK